MTQEEINQIECFPETVDNKPPTTATDCPHKNRFTKLLGVYCTCEVTAVFCKDCGQQLTEEEWDC